MSNTIKLDDYLLAGSKEGKTYREMMEKLTLVKIDQQAYGDWYYFRDDAGNVYEEWHSLGD